MKIAVVMPVYNAEKYLSQAIESILQQTYGQFQFIIVNDASTDSSPEIIQRYARQDKRIKVLTNVNNLRISRTLNRGMAAAQAEYIVRMDADDVAVTDRLAKQVAYMDSHQEVGISGGTMQLIDEQGRVFSQRRYHLEDETIRKYLFRYSPFSHPTVIIRKSILDQAGYYDPAFDFAEDYDLYFRIGKLAKFGNLFDTLLLYRVVNKSITSVLTKTMELKTLMIRKKAVKTYDYQMTGMDRLYWWGQYCSIYIIPYSWKKWLFTKLASRRISH